MSNPRILITNDDGVNARGLASLREIAAELSNDVWIVAPETEQSGAARSLSLSQPVRLRRVAERVFAVSGTPSDSVVMGVYAVLDGKKPDLLLSGVNHGQNLAEDITFSGTIAGALQGMTLGIPSIALSQAKFSRDRIRFQTARAHGPALIRDLLAAGWPANVVINVNFPDTEPDEVKGIEATCEGIRDQLHLFTERRTDLRERDYYWIGYRGALTDAPAGTDLRAIYDGRISVTPLHLDLTHAPTREKLARMLSSPRDG